MRWDTRIAVLAGLLCLLIAGWYFRVFRPAELHPGILVDFAEPPTAPSELTFDQWSNLDRAKQSSAKLTPPKQDKPTRRLALPSLSKPKVVEPGPPVSNTIPLMPAEPQPAVKDTAAKVEPKTAPAEPQPRIYTVKPGDSLWKIAQDQLGDPARHVELLELNKSTLKGDPGNLSPGQKLILPPK